MSTDGVVSSFTCRRPRRTPGAAVHPTQVPFTLGSSTFVSIDPGITDLAVRVRAELTWPHLRDGRVDMEARESWRRCRVNPATTIPTSKTAQVALYLDHARLSLAAFPVLFEHYKAERPLRWKTYCREQKALHSICMRVKGNKSAKKEDVVVAYGDGRFGSTMVYDGGGPVKECQT
ncbi:hypothetical protein V1520DRAFT_355127 [Lipomyces starkeyi]